MPTSKSKEENCPSCGCGFYVQGVEPWSRICLNCPCNYDIVNGKVEFKPDTDAKRGEGE